MSEPNYMATHPIVVDIFLDLSGALSLLLWRTVVDSRGK